MNWFCFCQIDQSMSVDRPIECRHHVDEKHKIGNCRRAVYGRCPACQRRVCLQHLSEHHKNEIEPRFDSLVDRANQLRARLETMSIDGTRQRAQQFVDAWKRRTIASIERAAADKLIEIDNACGELASEMSQFKTMTLEKLKTDMLLSAPHMHRDFVHPDELNSLEEHLTVVNSHIDRYLRHELLEESTTPNTPHTPPVTPQEQEQDLSSTLVFYHDRPYYQ